MRRYETIYILRPNLGEEEISTIIENTNAIILEEKGSVIELNKWGMKKLAYLIKKESLGYYIYCDYAGTPAAVSEIERKFRIDDAVLKYMTIKTASSISEEQIQQAIGDVSARESEAQKPDSAEETDVPEEQVPAAATTKVPAAETTKVPAAETTKAPAVETTKAPAVETTKAPAAETTKAPVVETTESDAEDNTEIN